MRTEGPVTKKGAGLYFNAGTRQILPVADAVLDPGRSWRKSATIIVWVCWQRVRNSTSKAWSWKPRESWFGLTAPREKYQSVFLSFRSKGTVRMTAKLPERWSSRRIYEGDAFPVVATEYLVANQQRSLEVMVR